MSSRQLRTVAWLFCEVVGHQFQCGRLQHLPESRQLNRLAEVIVHASRKAGFVVAFHRVGRHGDDPRFFPGDVVRLAFQRLKYFDPVSRHVDPVALVPRVAGQPAG